MATALWVIEYVVQALWWLWLARWGGAEAVRGWQAAWLLHAVAWRWDASVIRFFAWLSLAASTGWFVLGLFEPSARPFGP